MSFLELGLTLVALAVVLLAVMLLGKAIGGQERKAREAAAVAEKPVLVAQENRSELLAAISAVLAEEMGTSISALRIVSLKRIS